MVRSRLLGLLLIVCAAACDGQGSDTSKPKEAHKAAAIGLMFLGMPSPYASEIEEGFIEVQEVSPYPTTAMLYSSFGNDRTVLDRYLKTLPESLIEIHPTCEACRRNSRMGASDLLPHMSVEQFNHALEFHSHDEEIKKWLKDVRFFAEASPEASEVTFMLSLGLESNYTKLAAMNMLRLALEVWPYEIAYNPIDGDCSYMPEEIYCETHGLHAGIAREKCIISMDGHDSGPRGVISAGNQPATKEEVKAFITRGQEAGCITLLWSGETQGISDKFVPTLQRRFKLHPDTVEFFKALLID